MRSVVVLPVVQEEQEQHSRDLFRETDGGCLQAPGRCEQTVCRFHLLEDRSRLRQAQGVLEEPCAIKLADRGPMQLEAIGNLFGLTRERVRQIQNKALEKLAKRLAAADWPIDDIAAAIAANQRP